MIETVLIKCEIEHASKSTIRVPISSMSARIRSGDPSYLQVTVTDVDYSAQIADRSDGELHVYKKIGPSAWEEILWVDIESITVYKGSNSSSITISGHRTFTNSSPVTRTITTDYSYTAKGDETTVRCSIINTVLPVDRFIITRESIDIDPVDYVSINVGSGRYTLEVRG
jgi:hypothetical protein